MNTSRLLAVHAPKALKQSNHWYLSQYQHLIPLQECLAKDTEEPHIHTFQYIGKIKKKKKLLLPCGFSSVTRYTQQNFPSEIPTFDSQPLIEQDHLF